MSNNIVQFNEEIIKWKIKELVRRSVEETLNGLLEAEAEKLTQAAAGSRPDHTHWYHPTIQRICKQRLGKRFVFLLLRILQESGHHKRY